MIEEINKYVEVLKQDTDVLRQMLAEDDSLDRTLSENDETVAVQDHERKP